MLNKPCLHLREPEVAALMRVTGLEIVERYPVTRSHVWRTMAGAQILDPHQHIINLDWNTGFDFGIYHRFGVASPDADGKLFIYPMLDWVQGISSGLSAPFEGDKRWTPAFYIISVADDVRRMIAGIAS